MKTTLNTRNFVMLLMGVLFSMSLTAQDVWTGAEKVIPDSLYIADDITQYNLTNTGKHGEGPSVTEGSGGFALEYINGGDWIEFKILAAEAGQYALTAPVSSKNIDAKLNVSVYKDGDEFVMNGTTTAVYNGQWQTPVDYVFPFTVEAGEVYNLRVSFVGSGCNFFNKGLYVGALKGSSDATLSDLQINGETIANFDPATLAYTLVMQPDDWISTITATANDPLSTVVFPDDVTMPEDSYSASYNVSVTSESGVVNTYIVKVIAPIEIKDALDWDLSGSFLGNTAYYNYGAALKSWGVYFFGDQKYFDLYVYSAWDANYDVRVSYSDGNGPGSAYPEGKSYLNVSTLNVGDTTWMFNDLYTKYLSPTYYAGDPVPNWDYDARQDQDFVVSLKEYEPVLLRFYSVVDGGKGAHIQEMGFSEISGSIDATLSDLTVDGTSVIDFDPMTTTYSVALPAGATTATVAATVNDANSTVVGGGVVDIVGNVTTDTLTVVSESGFDINYIVKFYTPIAVDFASADTFSLAMSSDMFYNGGSNVSNTLINKNYDSAYVEYYIYSETDKDVHLVANMANGNPDTISCEMNVSTYTLDTEWMLDNSNTRTVPYSDSMMWNVGKAEELEFNLSLKANEAVMLRLFFITDGTKGSGDIHNLYILDGVSSSSPYVAEESDVNIYGGTANLTVDFGSNAGSTVKVFNIAGRLVVNETTDSSKKVYSVNQAGVYIVQVVDADNNMKTVKCLVK